MHEHFNPFQGSALRIPEEYRNDIQELSRTRSDSGQPSEPDSSPFSRYVDVWFLALCIGANMDVRVKLDPSTSHEFVTGVIFASDPWRVDFLQMLAIAETDDPDVVSDPGKVISIANDLAATGLPTVLSMVREGHGKPIWNLSDAILRTLTERSSPSAE